MQPRRGRYKPPGLPKINRQHPLAAGLVFYGFDAGTGSLYDLAKNRPCTMSQGMAPGRTAFGQSTLWTNGPHAYFNSDAAIRQVQKNGVFTYACMAQRVGTLSPNSIAFGRTADNGGAPTFSNWGFYWNANGGAGQDEVGVGFNNLGGVSSALWSSPGGMCSVAFTCSGAPGSGIATFYGNGAQIGQNTGLTIEDTDTNDAVMFSGNNTGGVSAQFAGFVPWGGIWSRCLRPSEILELHLNPYSFLSWPEDELLQGGRGRRVVVQVLTAQATASPSLARQANLMRSNTAIASPSLFTFYPKLLSAVAKTSASVAHQSFARTLVMSATVLAAASEALTTMKIAAASAVTNPFLITGLGARSLSAAAGAAASLSRLAGKSVSGAAHSTSSVLKEIGRAMAHAIAATAALTNRKLAVISSSSLAAAALVRSVSAVRAGSAKATAALQFTVGRAIVAAVKTVPRITKAAETSALAAANSYAQIASLAKIVRAAVAGVAPQIVTTSIRPIAGRVAAMASLARSVLSDLTAAASGIGDLLKRYGKPAQTSAAAVAVISRVVVLYTELASAKITVVTLRTARAYSATLTGRASAAASLARKMFRAVATAASAAASLLSSAGYDPKRQISLVNESFAISGIIGESFAGQMPPLTFTMPAPRTSFTTGYNPLPAGSSALYLGQIVDEQGNPLGAAALDTLTLSIVDTTSGAIVNGADQLSILNTGRGSIDALGNMIVTLQPGDTELLNAADQMEERSLIIHWTYGGTRIGRHQVDLVIAALSA